MAVQPNIWDTSYNALILNLNDANEDTLLQLIKIIGEGANPSWTFWDTFVACVWSGKFDGAPHPTISEISCNMIPIVELAPDIRDTTKCIISQYYQTKLLESPDCRAKLLDGGIVLLPAIGTPMAIGALYLCDKDGDYIFEGFGCALTYAASAYDVAEYAAVVVAAATTIEAGGSGSMPVYVGMEAGDLNLATLKVFFKNVGKELGKKVTADAWKTLKLAPDLFKLIKKISMKAGGELYSVLKSLVKVLAEGEDIARSSMNIFAYGNYKWTAKAIDKTTELIKNTDPIDNAPTILNNYHNVFKNLNEVAGDSGKELRKIDEKLMQGYKSPDFVVDNTLMESKKLTSTAPITTPTGFKDRINEAIDQLNPSIGKMTNANGEIIDIPSTSYKIANIDATTRLWQIAQNDLDTFVNGKFVENVHIDEIHINYIENGVSKLVRYFRKDGNIIKETKEVIE